MRTPQVLAATAAVALAIASVAVGPAASATASGSGPGRGSGTVPGLGRCPTGLLCVWTGPGFSGAMTKFLDDPNWAGQCRLMRSPIRSVANLTADAPWRLNIFLFHNPKSRPCKQHGVYGQYLPGQSEPDVHGPMVTAVEIYANPNPVTGR